MTGTTNRVPFEDAADLVPSARACLAFVVDGRPRVEPVVVRHEDSRFLVGVAETSELGSDVGEVSLVIDEGVLFFDLRAISVRGRPDPLGGQAGSDLEWFVLHPSKLTCWDYGRLRASDEDH